jgi:hypothetical protein
VIESLVVDTNVFVHAHNQEYALSAESRALTRRLIDDGVGVVLCLDPGYNPIEGQNRSRIMSEYYDQLVPGMLAHQVLQVLAASKRLRAIEPVRDREIKAKVNEIVSDQSDKIFLLVALATTDKVLVSHDDIAFPDVVREECLATWSVDVCEAGDALNALVA